MTQWVPLYESDADTVKSEIATFFDVFPDGAIFANELNGGGYDLVLLGWAGAGEDRRGRHGSAPGSARPTRPWRIAARSGLRLRHRSCLALTPARLPTCSPGWPDAQINRDGNLRLQYLAGMALNNNKEGEIYGEMLKYRQYPDDLFKVSDALRPALMQAIQTRGQ